MTVKKFYDRIKFYQDEIGCRGEGQGFGSHGYDSDVSFILEDEDGEFITLDLVEDEASHHGGCHCWNGILLTFKKSKDQ